MPENNDLPVFKLVYVNSQTFMMNIITTESQQTIIILFL